MKISSKYKTNDLGLPFFTYKKDAKAIQKEHNKFRRFLGANKINGAITAQQNKNITKPTFHRQMISWGIGEGQWIDTLQEHENIFLRALKSKDDILGIGEGQWIDILKSLLKIFFFEFLKSKGIFRL
ncbi:hypothetical protein CEXT_388971 [Caerostris extrusa]|uniref:SCP domain-containing protein n=1 Tax=Caerostris extrusa TaxID=172846 RepID=A0AAV4VHS5_CAEEX|nr:hypothetical protein CEXT_388971 [Caerostris extrusa]